ncbi:MAG: serine protein kinase RIO [Candidatus Altiarchaeota archaeon]|nr:serine protein kinase RIO [Candidatus Altiarchaeota archaeon]
MDKKVLDKVFDKPTLMNIHALFNRGIFREFGGPIADGKEARVFTAFNDTPLAVKVYRIDVSNFETIMEYIKGDPRFWHIGKNKRTLINAWVKKEYGNLRRMYSARIKVPTPLAFRGNVLVMGFIGDKTPSPQLRNARIEEPEEMFWKIIKDVKTMYEISKLVHADLSEYNILVDPKGEPVIIDVGQAVDKKHPTSDEYLRRDISNVCRFFSKWIKTDKKEILDYVTEGKVTWTES